MLGDAEADVDADGRAAPSARAEIDLNENTYLRGGLAGAAFPPRGALEMEAANANGSLFGSRPNNHKARESR